MLSKTQSILISIAFFIFVSFGATLGPDVLSLLSRGEVSATLGDYQFEIPEHETVARAGNPILRKLTGLGGKDQSVVFSIAASELRDQVPGYKVQEDGRLSDVKGIIRVWSRLRIEQYQKPERYRDLWYGQGSYHNRVIEAQSDSELYRVFRDTNKRSAWVVLNQQPSASAPQPDLMEQYWVARCSKQGSVGPFSERFVMCNSYFFMDDIVVEFYLAEHNLSAVADIRNVIREKIETWKTPV
ncbi:MAG: hypothetical protein COB04_09275 [Gammaproteobacteria bacterium]|nr:MAG: hypothetical protein COB04_09275 [Gammaproteobacteria bacterium]